MTSDDLQAIQREANEALEIAKLSLDTVRSNEDTPEHFENQLESARNDCEAKVPAVKAVINFYEDQLKPLKKSKREIDNEMDEIKSKQRVWTNLRDDLQTSAKQCNGEFWNLKRITNKPS